MLSSICVDDHRLMKLLAFANNSLLGQWHLSHVDFNAQIATGNHHSVGFGDNFVKPIERFALFYLGDHARSRTARADDIF